MQGVDGNIMGGEHGWLCQRPPWGRLVAVDVQTGDIAWNVPLGITDELPDGKKNKDGPTSNASFGEKLWTL